MKGIHTLLICCGEPSTVVRSLIRDAQDAKFSVAVYSTMPFQGSSLGASAVKDHVVVKPPQQAKSDFASLISGRQAPKHESEFPTLITVVGIQDETCDEEVSAAIRQVLSLAVQIESDDVVPLCREGQLAAFMNCAEDLDTAQLAQLGKEWRQSATDALQGTPQVTTQV